MGHEGHDHDHDHHDHHHHPHQGHAESPVAMWVITSSDTRDAQTDEGGKLARDLIVGAGHSLLGSELVKDDAHALNHALDHGLVGGDELGPLATACKQLLDAANDLALVRHRIVELDREGAPVRLVGAADVVKAAVEDHRQGERDVA